MKPYILVGLLIPLVANGEDLTHKSTSKKTSHHRAVKRLDTTPNESSEDAWTFGVEENEYSNAIYLNPTIDYSGKNGWDVNFTTFNVPVSGNGAQTYQYDAYVGISKTFDITKDLDLVVGSQNGTPVSGQPVQLNNMDYAHIDYDVFDQLSLYVGPYFVNKALSTTTNTVGFVAGLTAQIIPKKLHIQMDYTSGQSNVSGAEVNLQWYVKPNVQLYMGVLVPEHNSGNEFAGVVGFNYSTKSLIN